MSVQCKGAAAGCVCAASASAALIAGFSSAWIAAGSTEMNSAVPLRATRSSHCRVRLQGMSLVTGTQSASAAKKVLCCAMRNASVLTPILRVRLHSRPLVSSPMRCASTRPAAR